MTEDLYQQAKSTFAELVELSQTEQRDRLAAIQADSPNLAEELRSLLEYHTAQSLVITNDSRRIRTRSTLSATLPNKPGARLGGLLRGLLIALPFLLCAAGIAWWTDNQVRKSIHLSVRSWLESTINGKVSQFRQWEQQQLAHSEAWVRHPDILQNVSELLELSKAHATNSPELITQLSEASPPTALINALSQASGQTCAFTLWDRRMLTIATTNAAREPLGEFAAQHVVVDLAPVFSGEPRVLLRPRRFADSENPRQRIVVSTLVPIFAADSSIVAVMQIEGQSMNEEFLGMLVEWTSQPYGEVYLVDEECSLLSDSRYGDALLSMGLNIDDSRAPPTVIVKDPGVNLLEGQNPNNKSQGWPFTLMAQRVTAGDNGSNLDGYRNYVGQPVVGAWRWLPSHQLGIALEQDYSHAIAGADLVHNAILLTGLLISLGLVGISVTYALWMRPKPATDTERIGPYATQELLGRGGMGRVYLAEHELLCRQAAVKILTNADNDLNVISRFEREVQLASQLTHPNTVTIYDFGRTAEGLFYYAMEYIHGAHLGQLIELTGPLAPGRCIFILRQLCRALTEAHEAGVVHRDIKPQNIMVCNRAGEPDFVKLVDYGLVKSFAPGATENPSQTRVVVGTPRFMAPERLNSPWLADPRVDVYSVGAVAYYLLTAQLPPLVTIDEGMDNEQPGVETLDLPLGVVDFGGLLSVCLSVDPTARPASMRSMIRELEDLAKKHPWTADDSVDWWTEHEDRLLHLVKNKRKTLTD